MKQTHRGFEVSERDALFIKQLSDSLRPVIETPGSYKDKAAALRIPVGTVRSRLNRARTAIASMRDREAKTEVSAP